MKLAVEISRGGETRSSPENESVPVSASNFLAFFGINTDGTASVSIDEALEVPAVLAATSFLPRTLASLPLHALRVTDNGPERIKGGLQTLLHDAPNPDWTSFAWRQYLWDGVFTGGRGLAWIERAGTNISAIWPMDPAKTTVKRVGGRKVYKFENKEYSAAEVIDVPFRLKSDQITAVSPIAKGARTIRLALDMNSYGRGFFKGGGVPPLALVGPVPAGPEAIQRALAQVQEAIDVARASGKPIVNLPPGYELKPIGFEPEKGQMTEAQRYVVEEIARIWQLPPVFLQDLSRGTFSNTEQQDLHLVKHLISQWAKALEQELNLKLFGQMNTKRYAEHNLDGLMRGDFKSRIEGIVRGVQAGVYQPEEGRHFMGLPDSGDPNAKKLYMQGATVPLGTQPVLPSPKEPATDGADNDAAA